MLLGVRPAVPPKCPTELAELMKDCWKAAPDERKYFKSDFSILNCNLNISGPMADDALLRLKMIQ